MYVCICNAISESVDAVYASLGKRPQCGQCLDEAAEILIEEREGMCARAIAA